MKRTKFNADIKSLGGTSNTRGESESVSENPPNQPFKEQESWEAMMAVDGRRLRRAGMMALAASLVLGGFLGFAKAAIQQGEDVHTLIVPAPRPGDQATYSVQEIIVNPAAEQPTHYDVSSVAYEWQQETWGVDANFQHRLVHPLRYAFKASNTWEHAGETAYDAATGEPVSDSDQWAGSFWYSNAIVDPANMFDLGQPGERSIRYDYYQGQVGVCGMSLPFAGRAYDGGEYVVRGRCGWPGDGGAYTFQGQGWRETDTGPVYRFVAEEDPRFVYDYDESSPFPVKFSAVLYNTPGRYLVLDRIAFGEGTGAYTPLSEPEIQAGQPVQLVAQTAWMLDDTGLSLRFKLAQAYQAALGETISTGSGQTARQWLAQHSKGYLAFAQSMDRYDNSGQRITTWSLLWTDGETRFGKEVEYGPPRVDTLLLPSSMGEAATVRDWSGVEIGGRLAPPELVPIQFPDVTELFDRFSQLTDGTSATSYGFGIWCGNNACDVPYVTATAGRRESGIEPRYVALDRAVGTFSRNITEIEADDTGHLRVRVTLLASQDGWSPAAPSSRGDARQERTASGWLPPNSPVAATSIGLVALLAGALYYFWPATKTGLGIGLFSRIKDDDVLDLPARRRIHDAILAEPGIHFMALVRQANVGRGALDHHLRRLVAANLVTVHKASGYKCYFAKGTVDRHIAGAAPMLRSEGSRAVFDAVRAEPGLSGRELARRLGRSPSTINYHLQRLQEAGLIIGEGAGIRLSPLGKQAASAAA